MIVSLIILIFLTFAFIISLFTHLTLSYVIYGPLLLLAIRIPCRKLDLKTAFSLGLNATVWPYIVYLLLGFFIFRSVCMCPLLHIIGLFVIPVTGGILTVLFNFIPESSNAARKPDLVKDYKLKL